jgi:hypothetical protein
MAFEELFHSASTPGLPPGVADDGQGAAQGETRVRLVVRRVDCDEKVDRVIWDSEIVFVITVKGRHHVSGFWANTPIEWPDRATYVVLADGKVYRTQSRSLEPLLAALPQHFVAVNRGLGVNLDRVRFLSRARPLFLGFELNGSTDPKDALWALVAGERTREIEKQLGWMRRTVRKVERVPLNADELVVAWQADDLDVNDPYSTVDEPGCDDDEKSKE